MGLGNASTSLGQHLKSYSKPEQGQHSSKTLRAPGRGQQHSLLGISCRPIWVSHLYRPLFPDTSPLPSVRALFLHFTFTGSNLTSPLSAFWLFFTGLLCLSLAILKKHRLFYFCPQKWLSDGANWKRHNHCASSCRHQSHRLSPLF